MGLASTAKIFTPLLHEPKVNPHATLITLFINAVEEEFLDSGDDDNMTVVRKEAALVSEYLPYRANLVTNDPYLLNFMFVRPFVRDVERYLERSVEQR